MPLLCCYLFTPQILSKYFKFMELKNVGQRYDYVGQMSAKNVGQKCRPKIIHFAERKFWWGKTLRSWLARLCFSHHFSKIKFENIAFVSFLPCVFSGLFSWPDNMGKLPRLCVGCRKTERMEINGGLGKKYFKGI